MSRGCDVIVIGGGSPMARIEGRIATTQPPAPD
jgi:hypothetical protein